MDEKPNRFIINNEEPLDDNGFSSVSNHQNIDNFDDSSKGLQNDQSNQLNNNILKNTNPQMHKQNNKMVEPRVANPIQNGLPPTDMTMNNKNTPLDGGETYVKSINDSINEEPKGFKNRLKTRLFGKKEETDEADEEEKTKKKSIKIPIISSIIGFFSPVIIIIIIIAVLFLPLIIKVQDLTNFVVDTLERFGNFFTFKGFKTNQEIEIEFYSRVDRTIEIYPDMSREDLIGVLYYGLIPPQDYLDNLPKDPNELPEDDRLDFWNMKRDTFSIANQLVYSTVVFNNDIIKDIEKHEETVTVEENGKKVKKKVIKEETVYRCPASSYTIYTDMKEFCDENNVAIYKDGPGNLDYSTADYCLNLVSDFKVQQYLSDEKFNKKMKCVSIEYQTDTETSNKKTENFLRYVLLPDTYFDEYSFGLDGYKWDEMVSKFSSEASKYGIKEASDKYNIPAHEIGTKVDYYSDLSREEKRKIEDGIRTIMAIIETAKNDKGPIQKYYIPGGSSLPLDFTIRDTPLETIKGRISGGSLGLFGPRVLNGKEGFHHGVDFAAHSVNSDPIYAVLDGVVVESNMLITGCGTYVKLGHDTNNDGSYDYYSLYCHMYKKFVNTGDTVNNGQQIGIVGSTGDVTGPHLHFAWYDKNNNAKDPIPVLVSILENTYAYSNQVEAMTSDKKQKLENTYSSLISGNLRTRKGVALTARFLIDNLPTLPFFCGGNTTNLIDINWFSDKTITDKACSNYNTNSKYGLDGIGFINWVLMQSGYSTKNYKIAELLRLGKTIDMFDNNVQIGDIAYSNSRLGIIVDLSDTTATVISMEFGGLKAHTVNRNQALSLFPNVVSMDNFYKGVNS